MTELEPVTIRERNAAMKILALHLAESGASALGFTEKDVLLQDGEPFGDVQISVRLVRPAEKTP